MNDCVEVATDDLCGVAVVETEGAPEPLRSMNITVAFPLGGVRDDQLVVYPPVIALPMIMGKIFSASSSECVFAKEDHSLQTLFFDRLHETFGE